MTSRVRFVERSLKSLINEVDPNFYEDANSQNQTVYEFSNGRKFKGRRLYANYFPGEFPIIDEGRFVTDEGLLVTEELTEAEYLAELME